MIWAIIITLVIKLISRERIMPSPYQLHIIVKSRASMSLYPQLGQDHHTISSYYLLHYQQRLICTVITPNYHQSRHQSVPLPYRLYIIVTVVYLCYYTYSPVKIIKLHHHIPITYYCQLCISVLFYPYLGQDQCIISPHLINVLIIGSYCLS